MRTADRRGYDASRRSRAGERELAAVKALSVRQAGLVSVRNARMLRAGGWVPHDRREVCKLPESQGLQPLTVFDGF